MTRPPGAPRVGLRGISAEAAVCGLIVLTAALRLGAARWAGLCYMALAQAYNKREHPHYARALLRLGLEQYPGDPHLAHFLTSLSTPPVVQ